VLLVHGGPWYRDRWGYNGVVQWLANRGYAVLQVNFRGSTGYGKHFINAATREWGGKMHTDLVDGVEWAIGKGIADPKRIGIFGGSYGGYATLVGLTFTPELFRCGVDICGPSNLITWMETIPPYWKPLEAVLFDRVGDPVRDAEFLRERSPLTHVDRISKPLLIGQGANDPRVRRSESLQIVEALQKAGKEVEYVEYPDEGHGFDRPENRLDFFAKAERFLGRHLEGRYEP
jgi:dipeptidyl aminopeptidase/acylaminoacyl peptidase